MKQAEATGGSHTSLQHMPESLLHQILRLLSARDLAAVSVQDSYLRTVSADPSFWEPLALACWPGANAHAQYSGDWHRLYLARAQQPHALPLASDRIRTVTAAQQQRQAGGGIGGGDSGSAALLHMAFEDVMQQTFNAGLACGKNRAMRRTQEWRGIKQDLTWWATQRPEVVVAFIRSTHESLTSSGGWGGASVRGWADAPWRRSAVAFLLDLGLLTGAHASVVSRITSEAKALDGTIHRGQHEVAAVAAPQGLPNDHWWFS